MLLMRTEAGARLNNELNTDKSDHNQIFGRQGRCVSFSACAENILSMLMSGRLFSISRCPGLCCLMPVARTEMEDGVMEPGSHPLTDGQQL